MNKNKKMRYSVIFMCSLMLTACNQQGHIRDLSDYIEKLKKTVVPSQPKKDITAVAIPTIMLYQANNRRDPFEETSVAFTQKASASPLNAFPLSMLRYAGGIIVDNNKSAIIVVPDGKTYQVTVGDLIGDRYGKISKIEADHIEILDQILDEKNHPTQERVVFMQLKDGA